MESINEKKHLTKFNIFSFATAGFGQNLIIGIVNSFILFFYTDIFLLSASTAGILMIVARIWDALNDPIMGAIVDKTKSRWGKMRPYLLFIPLPLAISTAMLFLVPDISYSGKIIYAYVTYILWGMVYTICDVPFWGLASVMTPNPTERISFISISRLVHSIGGALPILIVPLFVKLMGGNQQGFAAAGISIGIIGSALFTLSFFGTKERCIEDKKSPTLKESLRYLKTNKPLLIVVLANVLGFMRAMPMVSSMYIATYLLNKPSLNIIILGGWGVAGYLGMMLTPIICKKFNFRQIYYIASVIGILGSLLLFLLGPSLYSITICLFLVGFPYGLVTNINYSMIADSVEYVEWKTGKRTEGVTISFQTLMNKMMTALQIGLVALMLVLINFKKPIKIGRDLITLQQSSTTLKGMFFMITLMPAIGWALSVIPIRYYNFIGKERQKAHEELTQARKAKANQELNKVEL